MAYSPRSEARKPLKSKAGLRPSSVVVKKTPGKQVAAKASAPFQAGKAVASAKAVAPVKPAAPTKAVAPSEAAASVKAAAPTKAVTIAKAPQTNGAAAGKSRPLAAASKAAVGRPVATKATPQAPSKAKLSKLASPVKAGASAKAPPLPAEPTAIKKPARKSIKEAAGVSTDAVARRTGKTWDDWFEVLDSAGAATLDQRGVIAILAQKHGIGPWWQQMIAVGYESLRGKSDKPPAPDGFQINSRCTLEAPVTRVFRLWNDTGERARWLADDRFVVRGATADKVIRARWGKGNSHVAVTFTEKSGRTEVSVDHHQIESRGAADQMKAYWAKKLGLLDEALTARR